MREKGHQGTHIKDPWTDTTGKRRIEGGKHGWVGQRRVMGGKWGQL